jgi:hypothetical protein
MPALRRTLAGELAALNGRLVDLLLKNAPAAELKAVQDEVRRRLDELEAEAAADLPQSVDAAGRPNLRAGAKDRVMESNAARDDLREVLNRREQGDDRTRRT